MQYSVPFRVTGVGKVGQITHVLVEARRPEDAIEAARELARLTGGKPRDLILEGTRLLTPK